MTQFHIKTAFIEAFQLPALDEDAGPFMEWAALVEFDGYTSEREGCMAIETPQGTVTAEPGDWIVKDADGQFYPCKPDTFSTTYEPADAPIDTSRAPNVLVPAPDTTFYAGWVGDKVKYHSVDQLCEYANARVAAALAAVPNAPNTNFVTLEGLRAKLLAPREIARDKDGWLVHPDFPVCDEDVRADKLLEAFGIESSFVAMDGDADQALVDRYFEDGDANCADWTPTPPEGDGWMLLEIYDTEDGPYALFARRKVEETNRERRARENAEASAETPAAQWRVAGEKDPLGTQYDCERSALTLGKLTDDELANAVFMHNHRGPIDVEAIMRGEPSSIALLTAAKERIRWLSRALESAIASVPEVRAPRPTDDRLWDQTLQERDTYHEWADKLAGAIAEHFGIDIGEHSSANNPWAMAFDTLECMPAAGEVRSEAMRYFVYDHEGGYNEFKTDAEREQGHQAAIDAYLDTHCDGWSEEVTNVVSGIVTHKTVQTNLEQKPEPCAQHPEHDDEDCESCAAWNEWPSHDFDTTCRYEPELIAAPASSARGKEVVA